MTSYSFNKEYNVEKLFNELSAVELMPLTMDHVDSANFILNYESALSSESLNTLNNLIESHNSSPIVIIPDVTPRQIRQALLLSGISLAQIDTAINSLNEPVRSLARVEWEYSNMFQRNRPLVGQVAIMLGWTTQQLDTLWLYASTL